MVYDCFLYYDENMLLDLRLNTLDKVVDRFVIVESTHTFTGKPKKLNFNLNHFSGFRDKIIYVIFDQPPHADAWQNEADTRNAIMRGLDLASDDDLILVSDVDEIFNPCIIKQISPRQLCTTICQKFYNYQFNLQVFNTDGTPRLCMLPKAVSYRNLTRFFNAEPETLRNVKRKNSSVRANRLKWQWYKFNNKIIQNGGWHFSWIMTPERISEKMTAISHTEYDLPEFNNSEHIRKALSEGLDIWGRDRIMTRQEITADTFPAPLTANYNKYKEFVM